MVTSLAIACVCVTTVARLIADESKIHHKSLVPTPLDETLTEAVLQTVASSPYMHVIQHPTRWALFLHDGVPSLLGDHYNASKPIYQSPSFVRYVKDQLDSGFAASMPSMDTAGHRYHFYHTEQKHLSSEGCPDGLIDDAATANTTIRSLRAQGKCAEADVVGVSCGVRGLRGSMRSVPSDTVTLSALALTSLFEVCHSSCLHHRSCVDATATSLVEKWTRYMLAIALFKHGSFLNCADPAACSFPLPPSDLNDESDLLSAVEYFCPSAQPTCSQHGQWFVNLIFQRLGENYTERFPVNVQHLPASVPRRDSTRWRAYGLTGVSHVPEVLIDQFGSELSSILDIVVSQPAGAHPITLTNNANGSFSMRDTFRSDGGSSSWVVKALDIDNDGDLDLLLLKGSGDFDCTCAEKQGITCCSNVLMRNDGSGNFSAVPSTVPSANGHASTYTSATLDVDLDGNLDIFVASQSGMSELWYNLGGGEYVDLAAEFQVQHCGYATGVAVADLDNDGYPDLAIAGAGSSNLILVNRMGDHFEEIGASFGVDHAPVIAQGVAWFDFNNDGWDDLFITSQRAPSGGELFAKLTGQAWEEAAEVDRRLGPKSGYSHLFLNKGGRLEDATLSAGWDADVLNAVSAMALNFADIDNDGFFDLYLSSGEPPFNVMVPSTMLRNVHGERFEDVSIELGFTHIGSTHGTSFADLNNDGHIDLLNGIVGPNTPDTTAAMYINPANSGNNWIKVSLTGVLSNSFGYLALLQVVDRMTGRSVYVRQGGSASFGTNPVSMQHIGVGNATSVDITVSWPHVSQPKDVYLNISVNTWVRLTEGGSVQTLPLVSFPASDFGSDTYVRTIPQ